MAKIMWTLDKFKTMVVNRELTLILLLQQFLLFLEGFPLNVGTWLRRFATIYTIGEALQFIPTCLYMAEITKPKSKHST